MLYGAVCVVLSASFANPRRVLLPPHHRVVVPATVVVHGDS
jgi:hypothetical protein